MIIIKSELNTPNTQATFQALLKAIVKDRSLLSRQAKSTGDKNQKITVENLRDLAGNHLFDRHPELFGISAHQGHIIREYLQSYRQRCIIELHQVFPDIFEAEREEFLQAACKVNLEPEIAEELLKLLNLLPLVK